MRIISSIVAWLAISVSVQAQQLVDCCKGRSLLDVGAIYSGAYPFVNVLKTGTGLLNAAGIDYTALLNSDGYPQSVPSTNLGVGIQVPYTYSGDWVIVWTGSFGTGNTNTTAAVALGGNGNASTWTVDSGGAFVAANQSGTIYLTGTNGSVHAKAPPGTNRLSLTFQSTATGLGPLTALAICRADKVASDSACLNAGDTIDLAYPAFINANYNAGILRVGLPWDNTNGNNRSSFSHDMPITAMSYVTNQFPPDLVVASASVSYCTNCGPGGNEQYSVPTPSGWNGLVDGATVIFYCGATCAANATTTPYLQVGSTTSTQIAYYNWNQGLTAGSGSFGIPLNRIVTFVYSAFLGYWQAFPSNSVNGQGLSNKTPVDAEIKLCNAAQKDCWFQIPYLFTLADAKAMATYVAGHLNSNLKAYFEFSNETITQNGFCCATAFPSSSWIGTIAMYAGFPGSNGTSGDVNEGYAYKVQPYWAGIKSIWPSSGPTLQRVCSAEIFATFQNVHDYRFLSKDMKYDANGFFTQGASSAAIHGTIAAGSSTYTQGPKAGSGVLTVVTVDSGGPIQVGQQITGPGVTPGTIIVSNISGSGNGSTWRTNFSSTISSSTAMTLSSNAVATDQTSVPNRMIDNCEVTTIAMYWQGPNGQITFTGDSGLVAPALPVTAITAANPAVVTATGASADWLNGDRVKLTVSGSYTITQSITASIANQNTLTITASPGSGIAVNDVVTGTSVPSATITGLGTGAGGNGTYTISGNASTVTATIDNGSGGSGNTLTVTSGSGIFVGYVVSGPGVTTATITALGTGSGGVGTYTIDGAAQNVSSRSMTVTRTVASETMTITRPLVWATVNGLSADAFSLSTCVDGSGHYLSCNTSGFTIALTSPTAERIETCLNGASTDMVSAGQSCSGSNYGLFNAMDDYASGTASRMTTALNWMTNDAINGTRWSTANSAKILGGSTYQNFATATSPAFNNGWSNWFSIVTGPGTCVITPASSPCNKPSVMYEGGLNADGISNPNTVSGSFPSTIAEMGGDASYVYKLPTLYCGWKFSDQFQMFNWNLYQLFMSFTNAYAPAQSIDVAQQQDPVVTQMTAGISNGSSAAGTQLNVTAGGAQVCDSVYGQGVTPGTVITGFVSGVYGGVGIYTVNIPQLVSAGTSMQEYAPLTWTLYPGDVTSTPFSNEKAIANFNAGMNFLLKRDLDPAANDNTPMWIDEAA